MDDIAALERANDKIILAESKIRQNGYTQPMSIEFTVPEIKALAYMARLTKS